MIAATWTAFLAYALVALYLGWRARTTADNQSDFWHAGRKLGPGSVGISISAGFMSVSWSCVYAVQLFYGFGLGAVWLITVPWLLALAGIHLLAPRYRRLLAFSQPEMVGARFNAASRRAVAAALALVFLVWGGAEIYVAANLLAPSMAVSRPLLIALIGLIVGGYTVLGGFGAVVSTDRLQFGIVATYVLAMAWLAQIGLRTTDAWAGGVGIGGSWSEIWSLPLTGAVSGRPWNDWLAPGAATIVLTAVAYLPGWIFETDLWLRVQAARDAEAARRGVLIAAVNGFLFVGLLPAFIGLAALVIFPVTAAGVPPEIGVEGDAIFAALVTRYAPAWMAALVALGLIAAAMSTIDTCVNVVALSVGYDLAAGTHRLGPRWVVATSTLAACGFALFTESLWDLFYLSSGVLTTAVAYPVAAVFIPGATRRSVLWSSISGLVVTVAAYFAESRGALATIQPEVVQASGLGFILWGTLAAAVAAGLGTWADRPTTRPSGTSAASDRS